MDRLILFSLILHSILKDFLNLSILSIYRMLELREELTIKVLVYGAGVIGSLYAAQLNKSGHDITILARRQRLTDIQKHGIMLKDLNTGNQTSTRIKVTEHLEPKDTYDLVIIALPKNHVSEVLPILAANNSSNVLFMGNNAAGPDELVGSLGHERVLMGFPGAGGTRDGYVVHYIDAEGRRKFKTTIGELNGYTTSRLNKIAEVFQGAGFPVTIHSNIDAWLKTHVAFILPIGGALYMANSDIYRLTRTRDAVVLMIRAIREGFKVLRTLGISVTPFNLRMLEFIPEPFLVALMRRRFNSEFFEVAFGHFNSAQNEIKYLLNEFMDLFSFASISTPTLDLMSEYVNQKLPPVADGCAQIPLKWRGVSVLLSVLMLLTFLILFIITS